MVNVVGKKPYLSSSLHKRLVGLLSGSRVLPKKWLGQNFLVDERILNREVELAGIRKSDTVMEVGPGVGFLTEKLATAASAAAVNGRVVAIEKDATFGKILSGMSLKNVELIFGDILKVVLPDFDVCVSNPPYNISSPLLFRLLEAESCHWRTLVFTFQEEFAKRLVATPGERNYGRLSASTRFVINVELLDRIPKESFHPSPKVDSRIVRITRKEELLVDINEWKTLCRTTLNWLFQHPGKTVKNALKHRISEKSCIPAELLKRRVRSLESVEILEIHRKV